MKSLTKFAFFAALCGMFVACDDSGASASDDVSSSSEVIPSSSSSSHSELVSESTSSSSSENVDPEIPQGDESNRFSVESSSSEVSSSSFSGIDPSTVIKGTMTDERDGKIYKTVTIGEQTWMAENLNYAYNAPTSTEDSSSFCYNNSADSCSKYGRLYLWSAAMDSAAVFSDDGKECGFDVKCGADGIVRGVCPEGWHLPNATEWSTLSTAVGGDTVAGTMLKSTSGWSDSDIDKGVDSYGFSVLSAGERIDYGLFRGVGYSAYFWSSMVHNNYYAAKWEFDYDYTYAGGGIGDKYYALSIRCVKD